MWYFPSITFATPSQEWRDILNDLSKQWRTDDEIKIIMNDLWYNTQDYFSNSSTKNTTYNSTQNYNTTSAWRNMLNQLRKEWRTDDEIKSKMEKAWLDTSWYFPENKTNNSSNNTATNYNNKNTTQEWRNILNQLRAEWRTDDEIKSKMEKAWLDTSWYFQNSSWNSRSSSSTNGILYTSRSCKTYDIEFLNDLWVYSSKNLIKTEYFVNTDYFKRYIDSKNPQKTGCPTNVWWISNPYYDSSDNIYRYIAPNWKVYFISNQNWLYTSNELSSPKSFSSIYELKNYIKERNPLVWMWSNEITTNFSSNISSNNSDQISSNNVDCDNPITVASCLVGINCPRQCQA